MPQLLRTRPVIDLSGSLFKKSQKLYYIVHGYVGHYNDEWAIILAHELLRRVSLRCTYLKFIQKSTETVSDRKVWIIRFEIRDGKET